MELITKVIILSPDLSSRLTAMYPTFFSEYLIYIARGAHGGG